MNPEIIETLSNRQNPGIDPHLHIWGWEIPGYLFLGGVVAGIMILLALMELRGQKPRSRTAQASPFAALGLISLGMLFLFLDLAHPLHVLRFYGSFEPTSPMSWGSWLLLVVYPSLLLLGLGGLGAEGRSWLLAKLPAGVKRAADWLLGFADRERKLVLGANIALGVGLGVYTGLLLGTMVARPMWHSSVLGVLFLVSGISTGAAFMMLGRLDENEARTLVRWDSIAIGVELLLLFALLLGYQTAGSAGQAAGAMVLGGAYTAPFWGLVVVAGLIVPLILNLLEQKRELAATRFAPLLVLIGGLALRAVIVTAGQVLSYGDFG